MSDRHAILNARLGDAVDAISWISDLAMNDDVFAALTCEGRSPLFHAVVNAADRLTGLALRASDGLARGELDDASSALDELDAELERLRATPQARRGAAA